MKNSSGVCILLLCAILMTSHIVFAAPITNDNLIIFDNALQNGFTDECSWSVTKNIASSAPGDSGNISASIAFEDPNNYYGAWCLKNTFGGINLTGYSAIQFNIHGGITGGQQLRLRAEISTSATPVEVQINNYLSGGPITGWRTVTIPFSDLSPIGGTLKTIAFKNHTGTKQNEFFLDNIKLVGPPQPDTLNTNINIYSDPSIDVDPKKIGTNAATFVPRRFYAEPLIAAWTSATGIKSFRIPGGTRSDAYGWLSCEDPGIALNFNASPCNSEKPQELWENWATRPTDFINFLKKVNAETVTYTMNVNVTPQEAAAAVAFFNATIDDQTSIGVDSKGIDWKTAGYWAQLRVNHGNPAPFPIKYWEIGNEVYGGKTGTNCDPEHWETTWTCDGTEYVNGITEHAGFLAMRSAMRAVDNTILVGAVGSSDPNLYSDWGKDVITAAGSDMDFYVIHPYAYSDGLECTKFLDCLAPSGSSAFLLAQILNQPNQLWKDIKKKSQDAFDQYAAGRNIPLAATEYNLVSSSDKDNNALMTKAVNALFIADSIGQALHNGFQMTHQWTLLHELAPNGSNYGLVQFQKKDTQTDFHRSPQYYTFPLWSRFGSKMLPVTSTLDAGSQLSVYAGRIDPGSLTLLAINKVNREIGATISLPSGETINGDVAYVLKANSLEDTSVTFNNVASDSLADDLSNAPPIAWNSSGTVVTYTFAPYSVTLLQMKLPAIAPGAPTGVTATAGNNQATISFTPPTSHGNSPITSYTVTATPGNITATGASSPITITGLNNSIPYTFTVKATNASNSTGPAASATTLYRLSVTIDGTGNGLVYSSPVLGINCTSGTCSTVFNSGTTINLLQSASNGSEFSGWGGACTGADSCDIHLNSLYQSVTSTFTTTPNARIAGKPEYYGLLQPAFNEAATGEVIQAKATTFVEALTMKAPKELTLKGGFDSNFVTQSDFTILRGALKVRQGKLVADHLFIR